MAVGFFDGRAGFAQFTDARISDPRVLALASKIRYSINPDDEYPRNFTGHLRATLTDGSQLDVRRPFMRGGVHAPLSRQELKAKFMDNVLYGGWRREQGERLMQVSRDLFVQPTLAVLTEFRS
jgi:2-methylcitrate dehydratase PrpD